MNHDDDTKQASITMTTEQKLIKLDFLNNFWRVYFNVCKYGAIFSSLAFIEVWDNNEQKNEKLYPYSVKLLSIPRSTWEQLVLMMPLVHQT